MIIKRTASIEPMQKNGKVYVSLSEVADVFGCARDTLISTFRKIIAKSSSDLNEVHIVNQKNVFVTIKCLKNIRGNLHSITKLPQFSEEETKAFFDELEIIEKEMQKGERYVCDVPESIHQKCYRMGSKQLVSSMQIGNDFGVLPSDIYMSLKVLINEYDLQLNRDYVIGKKPIIHQGESYDRPYFTHTGLLAVSMKLMERNGYNIKRIVKGFQNCMKTRFVFEAPQNSIFEYDDYMTMLSRYYKKNYRKAYLSVQDTVELKDLVKRFAALR